MRFDAPRRARAFLDAMVSDNLDIGRPNSVEMIFHSPSTTGRRPALGCTAKTKVVTRGVTVNAFHKHSRIKPSFKDGRALRIETVVNSPNGLRTRARAVIRRLLDSERTGRRLRPYESSLRADRDADDGRRRPRGRPRCGCQILRPWHCWASTDAPCTASDSPTGASAAR